MLRSSISGSGVIFVLVVGLSTCTDSGSSNEGDTGTTSGDGDGTGSDDGTGDGDGTSDDGGTSGGTSDGTSDGTDDGTPYPCEPVEPLVPVSDFFTDISDASGIRVDNFDPDPPPEIAINDHSRLAFADIDGDGFDDIVMHSLFPNPAAGVPFEHLVFRNNGDGTFEDVSDDSGLRAVQAGFFAFADVDNDGDQDVFAGLDLDDLQPHTSAIYLNDGAGHFTVLEGSGVESAPGTAANATFADFNSDGLVDLFVGHGGTTYAAPDKLYAGAGDGTFSDSSAALSGSPLVQPSNGSVTCDYDNDGDLDIFVSTYSVSTLNGLNHLWDNDGSGIFTEVAVEKGFASLSTGNYWLGSTGNGTLDEPDQGPGTYKGSNGFGIDCGDIDNDGDIDVLLTAISHPVDSDYNRKWSDPSQILANEGEDASWTFVNQWLARGLPYNEGDVDGALADFDNDGRLDISISRESKYEGNYNDPDQKSWFGLMRQLDSGAYESLGVASGINDPGEELLRMKGAQNHAWSDIDHDGDLDLLVGGRDQGGGRPNFLFRNEAGDDNRWFAVVLEGDGENVTADAFGTRLVYTAGDLTLTREKKSSRGMYNSEDTRTLHFGIGNAGCDYSLHVQWLDGTTATFGPQDFGEGMFVRITYPDTISVE